MWCAMDDTVNQSQQCERETPKLGDFEALMAMLDAPASAASIDDGLHRLLRSIASRRDNPGRSH